MTTHHRIYTALRRAFGPCMAYRLTRALAALKGTA